MRDIRNIKKAKLVSYDEDPNGAVVEQCTAPVFKITNKEYAVAASYDAGDPIEIQLSDLFDYQGTDSVNYEITCNGEPIGEIVNGFWAWTPTTNGSYDIDFKATISEDNSAVNYLTIRVVGEAPSQNSSTNSVAGDETQSGGCGSSIAGMGIVSLVMVASAAFVYNRRKNNE